MKKSPYYIIEIANTHGGNRQYLDDLITQFSDLSGNFGIKFQAFSPDTIATKDFELYPVYQELDIWSKKNLDDLLADILPTESNYSSSSKSVSCIASSSQSASSNDSSFW